jgi:hypothetical protein
MQIKLGDLHLLNHPLPGGVKLRKLNALRNRGGLMPWKQKVQVSDTTDDAMKNHSRQPNYAKATLGKQEILSKTV